MSDAGFAEAMYDEIYGLNCTIGQLTVENAKLRELVRELMPFHRHAWDGDRDGCFWCHYDEDKDCEAGCLVSGHAIELGIEVDE